MDDHTQSNRRTYLKTLATGTAAISIGSIAGCLGQGDSTSNSDTTETTGSTTATTNSSESNEIHSQYGFIGESMDVPAPEEANHEVKLLIGNRENGPVPEFYFDPAGLFVESGDVVKFVFATPDHAVTAFHSGLGRTMRVPDGVPALSSPMMTGGTYWLYKFDEKGVYDLYCPPHETFGMAMRVVVDEASGPATEAVPMGPPKHGEPRPPMQTAATVLNDDALSPKNIIEKKTIKWGELDSESKQLQQGN